MIAAHPPEGVSEMNAGCLYVVATPIGNLDDLSPRAIETLRRVECIAAEDTRHFAILAQRFGIAASVVAFHEHNERQLVPKLVASLRGGSNVALVSDAGTPLISDPGYRLVGAALEAGIRVSPLPGPCAAIAALSASGLASDRFVFEGFLPARDAARRARLQELAAEPRTLLFYESSHRIRESVSAMLEVFGAGRRCCLARELTKLHEQIVSATLGELPDWFNADANRVRGEFVMLVTGSEASACTIALPPNTIFELLRAELPPSTAAKLAAKLTGLPRKHFYAEAHADKSD